MNRAYYGWLAGASLSAFGDAAVFFALGWAAAGLGPHVAGLVLTAFTVPRAVLLLAGGVLGDRWGPRRVLLTCYLLLAALTFFLAGAVHLIGTSVTLLLLTASTIGTVDAFAIPAAGSFPRLFASDDELPRAMALRTSTQQVVTLLGGPAGGLLVATAGLVGALLVDAFTFLIAFSCLAAIKLARAKTPEPVAGSAVKEGLDGIRLAWTDPLLRALLLTVGLMAASVLPVTSLCVPLLARSNGWTASQAGLVVGATVAGGLSVTLAVARLGTFAQPGRTAAVGCLVAAAGVTGLSLASTAYLAALFAAVQGVGVGIFTSHLAPLFVASTPRSHLTRLQSVLALVQTLPLIGSMSLLGLVATAGIQLAVLACAAGTALAGATLLAMPRARAAAV